MRMHRGKERRVVHFVEVTLRASFKTAVSVLGSRVATKLLASSDCSVRLEQLHIASVVMSQPLALQQLACSLTTIISVSYASHQEEILAARNVAHYPRKRKACKKVRRSESTHTSRRAHLMSSYASASTTCLRT